MRTAPAAGASAGSPVAAAAVPALARSEQVLGLAEPLVGEAADRCQRLRRLRAGRADDELISAASPQTADAGETARVRGSATGARLAERDRGVEPRDGADQLRRGTRVEPETVADGDARRRGRDRRRAGRVRGAGFAGRRHGAPAGRTAAGLELSDLGGEATRGGGRDGGERVAEPGGHGGGDGSFDQRRGGEQYLASPRLVEQVGGQSGGEDGAPEVHEDQHAVPRPHVLDGAQHPGRVGAQGAAGLVEPAGGADAHLRPGHLRGQLGDALRERRAVADDDEADHGYAGSASAPAAPAGDRASTAEAVSSSSQELVAPGSWWPALRSPR